MFPDVNKLLALKRPDRVAIAPSGKVIAYTQLVSNLEKNQFDRCCWCYNTDTLEQQQIVDHGDIRQLHFLDDTRLVILWDDGRFDGSYLLYLIHTSGAESNPILLSHKHVSMFTPFRSGVLYTCTNNTQLEYKVVTKSYLDKPDYTLKSQARIINIVSSKPSALHAVVTLKQASNPSLIARVELTEQHGLTLIPIHSPPAHQLIAKAISECGQKVYAQGCNNNARYAQKDTWEITHDQASCLSEHIDRDTEIIGHTTNGLLIRFVDGLTAKLGWLDKHHITLLDINGLSSRIDAELTDNALVFIGQSAKHFPDVFCFNLNKQKVINVSGNHTQLTGLDFGLAKGFNWCSEDGLSLQGVLRFSKNQSNLAQAPVAVIIHGGPKDFSELQLFSDHHWYAPYLPLLAAGYVIFEPNYRGSIGQGQAFAQINVDHLGRLDMQDICSGIKALHKQYAIDLKQVIGIGWSQGGYICAYTGCHSNAFTKVIIGAAISDWHTYQAVTDIPDFVSDYLPSNTARLEASVINSPPTHKPDMLIIHGTNDFRVPIQCAQQLSEYAFKNKITHSSLFIEGMKHRVNKPSELKSIWTNSLEWIIN